MKNKHTSHVVCDLKGDQISLRIQPDKSTTGSRIYLNNTLYCDTSQESTFEREMKENSAREKRRNDEMVLF